MPASSPVSRVRRSILVALVGSSLAAALSGCGGASNGSVAVLDACALVDRDTVAGILGEAVTPKAIESAGAAEMQISLCNYETETLHHGFMITVGPHRLANAAGESAEQVANDIASAKEALPDVEIAFEPVSSLGDAAYLVSSEVYTQVFVYAGPYRLLITRNLATTPDAMEITRQIAESAADALP